MPEETKRRRGRPPRGEEVQLFSLRLPKDLHRALGLYVGNNKEVGSMNDLLVKILRDWWAVFPKRAIYERFMRS